MVFESLGYACKNNGFIFVINNHIWVCQNLINLYGSDELKEKYLPEMVEGKKLGRLLLQSLKRDLMHLRWLQM